MRAQDRKAAVSAYKERKLISGVYLIRCAASGEAWIGACAELERFRAKWRPVRVKKTR